MDSQKRVSYSLIEANSKLRPLFPRDPYADFVVRVESDTYEVQRNIIAFHSEYFWQLTQPGVGLQEVQIDNKKVRLDLQVFRELLALCYGHEVHLRLEEAQKYRNVAQFLRMPELIDFLDELESELGAGIEQQISSAAQADSLPLLRAQPPLSPPQQQQNFTQHGRRAPSSEQQGSSLRDASNNKTHSVERVSLESTGSSSSNNNNNNNSNNNNNINSSNNNNHRQVTESVQKIQRILGSQVSQNLESFSAHTSAIKTNFENLVTQYNDAELEELPTIATTEKKAKQAGNTNKKVASIQQAQKKQATQQSAVSFAGSQNFATHSEEDRRKRSAGAPEASDEEGATIAVAQQGGGNTVRGKKNKKKNGQSAVPSAKNSTSNQVSVSSSSQVPVKGRKQQAEIVQAPRQNFSEIAASLDIGEDLDMLLRMVQFHFDDASTNVQLLYDARQCAFSLEQAFTAIQRRSMLLWVFRTRTSNKVFGAIHTAPLTHARQKVEDEKAILFSCHPFEQLKLRSAQAQAFYWAGDYVMFGDKDLIIADEGHVNASTASFPGNFFGEDFDEAKYAQFCGGDKTFLLSHFYIFTFDKK